MRVQYSGHVIQAESHDYYTALPLVGVLECKYEFSYKLDQDLYEFLETGTSAYTPFHFSFTVPLKTVFYSTVPWSVG